MVMAAAGNSNSLAVVDVGTNPSSPYTSTTYIDGARWVAVSPDGMYAYVTGTSSNSLAVVDLGAAPRSKAPT